MQVLRSARRDRTVCNVLESDSCAVCGANGSCTPADGGRTCVQAKAWACTRRSGTALPSGPTASTGATRCHHDQPFAWWKAREHALWRSCQGRCARLTAAASSGASDAAPGCPAEHSGRAAGQISCEATCRHQRRSGRQRQPRPALKWSRIARSGQRSRSTTSPGSTGRS